MLTLSGVTHVYGDGTRALDKVSLEEAVEGGLEDLYFAAVNASRRQAAA